MRNYFTTFFTCCILLLYIGGSAQNLDSLNALLNETVDKENEAKLHQEIASIYFRQEKIKLAEFHLLEAREIYSNDTSSLNYAKTTLSLSGIFIKQKLFGKAYRFASDAAFIAEKNNYTKIRALAIYNISIILKETGRNAEAASYAKQAILLFAELSDSLRIAFAYNNMGMIAKNLEEWEEARAYYDTSLILKKKFEGEGYCVHGGENAPYLWIETPGRRSWEVFQEFMEKRHLIITPGAGYGPSGEHCIRVSAFGFRKSITEFI